VPDGFWQPLMQAPLIVVPLSNKDVYLDRYTETDKGWTDRDEAHWPVPYWHIDTGFVAMLLLLAVVDEGLGALYFGIAPPDMEPVKAAFGVPPEYTPIGAIAIGVPDEPVDARQPGSGKTRKRRSLNDVVHRGSW
jgi:nitroreductase